jgi:hypothetical protein
MIPTARVLAPLCIRHSFNRVRTFSRQASLHQTHPAATTSTTTPTSHAEVPSRGLRSGLSSLRPHAPGVQIEKTIPWVADKTIGLGFLGMFLGSLYRVIITFLVPQLVVSNSASLNCDMITVGSGQVPEYAGAVQGVQGAQPGSDEKLGVIEKCNR